MGRSQENILDTVTGHGESALDEDMPQVPIPEVESDGEYETIPSRKEKHSKDSHEESKNQLTTHAVPVTNGVTASQGREAVEESKELGHEPIGDESEGTVDGAVEPSTAVNDDDWLRSRTNRLLDLMDPADVPPPKRSDSTNKVSKVPDIADDVLKGAKSSDDVVGAVTPDEPAAETSTTPDTRDLIRRTSRLFLRNLPYGATEDEIREEFGKFGAIQEVRIDFHDCYTPLFAFFCSLAT